MVETELVEEVRELLSVDTEAFDSRTSEEADRVEEFVDEGVFDNPQGLVGLEYEFYAVANRADAGGWIDPERVDPAGSLERVPRPLLEHVGFEKELGLHNAELSTTPQPFNESGLRAQERAVVSRLDAAQRVMQANGLQLVSNGIWTIPPTGESAPDYLADFVTVDDLRFATNMSASARYHAMSNTRPRPAMRIELPYASFSAATVLPESLITSIQPHYQLPNARDLPTAHRYALRAAAPLVALAANSPFLPPDLYDSGATIDDVLEAGHDEHRIAVFEQVMNSDGARKVRFPHDVETIGQALDAIVMDPTLVPADLERDDSRFHDQFPHLRHKHGTFWRWVRPVFGGASRSSANVRIEFRPLPAQPTVRDTVGFQALIAGLMVGFRRADHPVCDLSWERAKENFYGAAEGGFDAQLSWIDSDGTDTNDTEAIYADLFEVAARGLRSRGIGQSAVDRYLGPLRERVAARTTPADWKRAQARSLHDDGASIAQAVYGAQQRYNDRQSDTLFDGSFAEWL